MRTSILILLCLALFLALAQVDAGKKKPGKPGKPGREPGNKPSKPGVKGECDVGSHKLTAGNTRKYTDNGSKIPFLLKFPMERAGD